MKNIKNILGTGALMLLTSVAIVSCTEKSDWDIDEAYNRPFGTNRDGISVTTDDRVARVTVNWDAMPGVNGYILEVSTNELNDDIPMGSEENGNLVFGNDADSRISRSPYVINDLEAGATYYLRIKSLTGDKESLWVYPERTFSTVSEETILNVPSAEDVPVAEGRVRMTWEPGLSVTHFVITEVGSEQPYEQNITPLQAAVGEAWIENLNVFSAYTIAIYNDNTIRGSQNVTIPGLEIESAISDITDATALFSWDATVDVTHYACLPSTEAVPTIAAATALTPAEIAAHTVTIPNLNPSTEYTAYAFYNGSICARTTFTTKKGKPVGYNEMSIEDAITNWANLSGNVLIIVGEGSSASLANNNNIPAGVTDLVFWGEGSQPSLGVHNMQAAGALSKLEFYNIDLYSTNPGGNFVAYQDNAAGSIDRLVISSSMIRDFRGVVRMRKTVADANLSIEIDDCVIKGLTSGHYGILHSSDMTGGSGAGSLASIQLNLTNSTVANFTGNASTIVRTPSSQGNVTVNVENCTFYGLNTSGEAFMRDVRGNTCTFNMSNTLFAASNTNFRVFYNASNAPGTINWRSVYTTSDFGFTNAGSTTVSSLALSSSQLFSCTDSGKVFDLTYGADVSNDIKAIGDQRWNK